MPPRQTALVPAPLVPKARSQENDELWPAALGICAQRLWASPATSDAARRHALAAEQAHHACGPPAAHTRHPQAWDLTEHKSRHATHGAGPLSAGVGATSCSSILLAAARPLVRHVSRMQLDWGCETPGRSEVRARRAAGRASRTPLAESEERNVADGADPAEHEHVKREPVVQLRHRDARCWLHRSERASRSASPRGRSSEGAVPADDRRRHVREEGR